MSHNSLLASAAHAVNEIKPMQNAESIGLHHRKNIARGIFEPGNRRSVPAHDAFLVGLQVTLIVTLESDATFCQLVDRTIDILYREIEDGKRRRNMIGLRINEDIIAAGQMQCEQAMIFRRLQSQCSVVKLLLLTDVRALKSS